MPNTHSPFGVLRAVDACELLQPGPDLLDNQVLAYSRRWQVVGIFVRCTACGYSQKASAGAQPFPHAAACRAPSTGEDFPWRELAAILGNLPT